MELFLRCKGAHSSRTVDMGRTSCGHLLKKSLAPPPPHKPPPPPGARGAPHRLEWQLTRPGGLCPPTDRTTITGCRLFRKDVMEFTSHELFPDDMSFFFTDYAPRPQSLSLEAYKEPYKEPSPPPPPPVPIRDRYIPLVDYEGTGLDADGNRVRAKRKQTFFRPGAAPET